MAGIDRGRRGTTRLNQPHCWRARQLAFSLPSGHLQCGQRERLGRFSHPVIFRRSGQLKNEGGSPVKPIAFDFEGASHFPDDTGGIMQSKTMPSSLVVNPCSKIRFKFSAEIPMPLSTTKF